MGHVLSINTLAIFFTIIIILISETTSFVQSLLTTLVQCSCDIHLFFFSDHLDFNISLFLICFQNN